MIITKAEGFGRGSGAHVPQPDHESALSRHVKNQQIQNKCHINVCFAMPAGKSVGLGYEKPQNLSKQQKQRPRYARIGCELNTHDLNTRVLKRRYARIGLAKVAIAIEQ